MENILDLNLYEILGVPLEANQNEIKKAYYREAKKYHPDNEHYNKQKWNNLQLAYEVLLDDNKRAFYNKHYCEKHGEFYFFNGMTVDDAMFIYCGHQKREKEIWNQYNQKYYEILKTLENDEEIKIIKEQLIKLENKQKHNVLDIIRLKNQKTYLKDKIDSIKYDYLSQIKMIRQERKKLLEKENRFSNELIKFILENTKQSKQM